MVVALTRTWAVVSRLGIWALLRALTLQTVPPRAGPRLRIVTNLAPSPTTLSVQEYLAPANLSANGKGTSNVWVVRAGRVNVLTFDTRLGRMVIALTRTLAVVSRLGIRAVLRALTRQTVPPRAGPRLRILTNLFPSPPTLARQEYLAPANLSAKGKRTVNVLVVWAGRVNVLTLDIRGVAAEALPSMAGPPINTAAQASTATAVRRTLKRTHDLVVRGICSLLLELERVSGRAKPRPPMSTLYPTGTLGKSAR
jgi:hypothetical protein